MGLILPPLGTCLQQGQMVLGPTGGFGREQGGSCDPPARPSPLPSPLGRNSDGYPSGTLYASVNPEYFSTSNSMYGSQKLLGAGGNRHAAGKGRVELQLTPCSIADPERGLGAGQGDGRDGGWAPGVHSSPGQQQQ